MVLGYFGSFGISAALRTDLKVSTSSSVGVSPFGCGPFAGTGKDGGADGAIASTAEGRATEGHRGTRGAGDKEEVAKGS